MAANLPLNLPDTGLRNYASANERSRITPIGLSDSSQLTGDAIAFQRQARLPSTKEQLLMTTPIGRSLQYAYGLLQKPWSILGHPLTGLNATIRFIGPTIYNRTPFLKSLVEQHISELPAERYIPVANHELGHALIGASANLEMDGLYLHKIFNKNGGIEFDRSIQQLAAADHKVAARKLVVLLGGHAAELNRSTREELSTPRHLNILRSRAYSDFVQSARLLKDESFSQALKLKTEDVPALDLPCFTKLNAEIVAAQKLPADQRATALRKLKPQIEQEFKTIEQFLALPVVQGGLRTAQAIHGVLGEEQREALLQEVAKNRFYDKAELYELLSRHVSKDKGHLMVQYLERFVQQSLHL